ncbi:MAG: ATP-binding cassette domain-containing protein [Boseongicola sp.]|nr:MAG: ATP-binding cassette domain-containing protein [Boseongicola sp.]
MIRLDNLTKIYFSGGVTKTVTREITISFPTNGATALIGRNGAGKSSLLKIIAGTMRPTSGRVRVAGSVSWPVGFAGCFHGDLSGLQNTRFVARVYGVRTDQLVEHVSQTAELGAHFHMPFRMYSSGMKARLAFAVSMGIDFDTYLIDEVTSVGDASFREKSEAMLMSRLQNKAAIVVSHNLPLLSRLCKSALVLENGTGVWFNDVDDAIAAHEANLAQ